MVHRSFALLYVHSPACGTVEGCVQCVLLLCRVKAACPVMTAEVLHGLRIGTKAIILNKYTAEHRPLAALWHRACSLQLPPVEQHKSSCWPV